MARSSNSVALPLNEHILSMALEIGPKVSEQPSVGGDSLFPLGRA